MKLFMKAHIFTDKHKLVGDINSLNLLVCTKNVLQMFSAFYLLHNIFKYTSD